MCATPSTPSSLSRALSSTLQAVDLPLPLGPTIISPWCSWVIWYSWRTCQEKERNRCYSRITGIRLSFTKMVHVESCPPSPRKFRCSEVASGGLKGSKFEKYWGGGGVPAPYTCKTLGMISGLVHIKNTCKQFTCRNSMFMQSLFLQCLGDGPGTQCIPLSHYKTTCQNISARHGH